MCVLRIEQQKKDLKVLSVQLRVHCARSTIDICVLCLKFMYFHNAWPRCQEHSSQPNGFVKKLPSRRLIKKKKEMFSLRRYWRKCAIFIAKKWNQFQNASPPLYTFSVYFKAQRCQFVRADETHTALTQRENGRYNKHTSRAYFGVETDVDWRHVWIDQCQF